MMLTMRIYDDIIVALLVMKPETMRHSTNSWLKIGTSVLARIILPARQSWAKQIRIPTSDDRDDDDGGDDDYGDDDDDDDSDDNDVVVGDVSMLLSMPAAAAPLPRRAVATAMLARGQSAQPEH